MYFYIYGDYIAATFRISVLPIHWENLKIGHFASHIWNEKFKKK